MRLFRREIVLTALMLVLTVGFLLFPFMGVQADETTGRSGCGEGYIKLQIPIPGLKLVTNADNDYCIPADQGFPLYIKAMYNLFIGIVGILAVIMMMLGGFQWLFAAGNAQAISGAKTTLISAVMGLILALGSYTILSLINPALLNLSIEVGKVDLGEGDLNNIGLCPKEEKQFIPFTTKPECGTEYIFLEGEVLNRCWGYYIDHIAAGAGVCYYDGVKSSEIDTVYLSSEKIDKYYNKSETISLRLNSLNVDCGEIYYKDTLSVGTSAVTNFFGLADKYFGRLCNIGESCLITKQLFTDKDFIDIDAKELFGIYFNYKGKLKESIAKCY